jgi:phospholipid/cholesterol/gamma-HCH transport system substrate-binding protein
MSGKSKKILVSVLIFCFVVGAGLAFLYWYAGHQRSKGALYVTYFSESVSGLVEESPVTYKGVPIGEIDKMGIAPDGKLVEVVFKVYDSHRKVLDRKMVTHLEPFGYTGILVLSLDDRKPGEIDKSPKLVFPTEYFVVPSRPRAISTRSDISVLNEKVDKILKHLTAAKSENNSQ